MIWTQTIACFVVWVVYGIFLRRGSDRLRQHMKSKSRGARVAMGSVGLIGSAAILLIGMLAVGTLGWIDAKGMEPLGWIVVTALGLIFVHMQVIGAASMITLLQERETVRSPAASQVQEHTEN